MPSNELPVRFLAAIVYELHIARVIHGLFGGRKCALFLASLPLSIARGSGNRRAFEAMGQCRMRIGITDVVFKHADPRFIDEIILKRCYSPSPSLPISADAIVIDAGANVGVFSIYAATQAVNGRILAIEPDEENFRYLTENIRGNRLNNIILINAALADKKGYTTLYHGNPGSYSIVEGSKSGRAIQRCRTMTMGDLLREQSIDHIDFMKIDIEGAEFLILKNPSWLAKVRAIAMEVHSCAGDIRALESILNNAGFETTTHLAYDRGTSYLYALRL